MIVVAAVDVMVEVAVLVEYDVTFILQSNIDES